MTHEVSLEYFERPVGGERALLVHMSLQEAASRDDLDEFAELARSAGVQVLQLVLARRPRPDARTYVGRGKLEEIRALVEEHDAEVVLFDHTLTPAQERNLERELSCRVLDRTGLILDIFAQRARTHEGKLQVELAQLEHLSSRLVRGWTHLERQKGGIGLRGPGETQLEMDRRLLRQRVAQLKLRLEDVRRTRSLGRQARRKASVPVVALVGYTNAGKSTLFNQLCAASVYAADQLFATLDPTLRRWRLEGLGEVVFADTVGFLRDLPHHLVDAFRATLEETVDADLLLQVVDVASSERERQMAAVEEVLQAVGADAVPRLLVYNKIDLLPERTPRVDVDEQGQACAVWLAAREGQGLDLLRQAIVDRLGRHRAWRLLLAPAQGRLRAQLYEQQVVREESIDAEGRSHLHIEMAENSLRHLVEQAGLNLTEILS